MVNRLRVPKTLDRKLRDLDDHLFLLRENLHGLRQEPAHLKAVAAELRTLLCYCGRPGVGTDGLLWRLADELEVSDEVRLHALWRVDRDHPSAAGLRFLKVPMYRPEDTLPNIPEMDVSLRDLVKDHEAVFVSNFPDKVITHEYLIKAVSQQMGSAHEDEGLELALDSLTRIFFGGVEPYVPVLAFDAELTLQIGERVLHRAERDFDYERRIRRSKHGEVALVVCMDMIDWLGGRIPICTWQSQISEVEVSLLAAPQSLVFQLEKGGCRRTELTMPYPEDWVLGQVEEFALLYSSSQRTAGLTRHGRRLSNVIECDLGWVDTREVTVTRSPSGYEKFFKVRFLSGLDPPLFPRF